MPDSTALRKARLIKSVFFGEWSRSSVDLLLDLGVARGAWATKGVKQIDNRFNCITGTNIHEVLCLAKCECD